MTSGSTFTHLIVMTASGPWSALSWSRASRPSAARLYAPIEPLEQGVALVGISAQPAVLAQDLDRGIEDAVHGLARLLSERRRDDLADAVAHLDEVPERYATAAQYGADPLGVLS